MVTSSTSGAVRAGRTITVGLLILSLAFVALALVSIATGVVRGGDSLLYGDPMNVPMQLASEDLGPVPDGIALDSWVPVDVEIPDPTTTEMLLRSALDLGPGLVVVWALWLLAAVMRSAAHGDPFGNENAVRFRSLGILLVAGGFALNVLNYALVNALFARLPPYPSVELGAGPFSPIPAGMLLGGLAAFALAAIFTEGSRLREDVEGTI